MSHRVQKEIKQVKIRIYEHAGDLSTSVCPGLLYIGVFFSWYNLKLKYGGNKLFIPWYENTIKRDQGEKDWERNDMILQTKISFWP